MTRTASSTVIDAPVERVWQILVDVESWPRWTRSVKSVMRLDEGPLLVGCAARIAQPGMLPLVWTVTEVIPQHSFTWVAHVPGVTITGEHTLTALPDGRTRLELAATGTGRLARLADRLTGARARAYVGLEAAGMKAAAEAGSDSPAR